jgi:tetraprenyl-beta-curcumene synthase
VRLELAETAAAASALGAYLFTVLPRVRRELRRWGSLPAEKARNAEAVAVFATLAPRSTRAAVVRAIVALQVAIDHLDALEEAGIVGPDAPDDDCLSRLEAEWRQGVAALPGGAAMLPSIERAVERCGEGQRRTHAAAAGEVEGLRSWAEGLDAPGGYRWWEIAAGAGSSVAAHALIARAADPAADESTGAAIDAAYFPSIGALTVLLDDLVDREADLAAGEHNYLDYYGSPRESAARLALVAERAAALVAQLPQAKRHRAILDGVAGYYLSAPEVGDPLGEPIRERLLESLGPGARLLASFSRLRRLR